MKNLLVIVLGLNLFSSAVRSEDHNLNFSSRAAWSYTDNDIKKTGVPSSSAFVIDYFFLGLAGNLSPSMKYQVTADFLENNDAVSRDLTSGTTPFLDEAFVTKMLSEKTSVSFGKIPILFGGVEYNYAEQDVYVSSLFWDSTLKSEVGFSVSQILGEQKIDAQVFNGNKSSAGQATSNQSKYGYGVLYQGQFLNGMIAPLIGYTVIPQRDSTSRDHKGDDIFVSAGVQLNTPHNAVLEIDYDLLTKKDADVNKEDLKTKSIVVNLKYSLERITPFVKYIYDQTKSDNTVTLVQKSFDLGAEFKDSGESTHRYFAHYLYRISDDKVYAVKSKPQSFAVGIVFDASLLE